jgi:hypothetical protein
VTSSMNDAAEMVKLGDNLMVPVEMLSPDLRRRWSIAQSRKVANEIATLMDEVRKEMAAHLLLRLAPRVSVTTIGLVGEHGGRFTDLSAAALEHAAEEKRKEGVKEKAGKERVRVE